MMNRYKGMNWLKRICGLALMASMVMSMFTGCQLAKEDNFIKQGENEDYTNTDIFCGAFICAKSLFYDDDLEISDEDLGKIVNGEEVDIYEDNTKGDRIYATKKINITDDGFEHEEYIFEGIEGIAAFRYFEVEDGKYPVAVGGTGQTSAADILFAYNATNKGTDDKITGTISVNQIVADKYKEETEREFFGLHVYPVYETREGDIYLTIGEGIVLTEGIEYELSTTTKSDITGEEKEYTCTVDIRFEVIKPVDNTVVYQMNADNEEIGKIEIDNTDIPESITVDKDAEYIIVEEYKDGKLIDRDMKDMNYDLDEDYEVHFETTKKTEDELFVEVVSVELKTKK